MTRLGGAGPRVFAILGDPVAHSLSPVMQNAAIRHQGFAGEYGAIRCDSEQVAGLMRDLASAGGGGNVTLPHKAIAAAALDAASAAVVSTGACNTFWWQDGGLHGDNTDVAGFGGAWQALCGPRPAVGRVLVLGAGGAAAAVLHALSRAGVGELYVYNRTVPRAQDLALHLGLSQIHVLTALSAIDGASFDLVVNATRLGLLPDDALPIDLAVLGPVGAVMDVVYSSTGTTPLVRAAQARGIAAADGTEMLIRQGAAAFERWWTTSAPIEVMRTALAGVGGTGS